TTSVPSPPTTATPHTLTAGRTFGAASVGITTLALAPDGKQLAGVQSSSGGPTVTLWDTVTGKQKSVLTWPTASSPSALAWSHDGQRLAAVDGISLGIWDIPSRALLWPSVPLPQGTALRVYDVANGLVVQRPNAATALTGNTMLRWKAGGQLQQAPASAGEGAIVAPDGPLIGLWQAHGIHLFNTGNGAVAVGTSPADLTRHIALLAWSPD